MKTNVCVCVCVCSVSQSCQTLCNPMDCSPPGSPVHGLFQAGILEWVAISFSRGFSQSGDQTCVSCIDRQILWPTTPLRTVLCVCVYMYIHPVGSVSLENPNACSLPLNFTRIYVYCFEICLKESLDSKRSSFLTFSVARIPFPLGNRNPWLSQHSNPLLCLSTGCCCSVAKLCPTPCDPMNCSIPGSLSFAISRSLLKLMSVELVMPSNHLILCHPLLLLSSVLKNPKCSSVCLNLQFSGDTLVFSGGNIPHLKNKLFQPIKHTGVEMGIKTVFPGCLCNNIKMSKAMLMPWFLNLLSMGAPYVGHMFKAYTSVCVLWSSISFQPQLRRKQKLFLKRKNIYQQERT